MTGTRISAATMINSIIEYESVSRHILAKKRKVGVFSVPGVYIVAML